MRTNARRTCLRVWYACALLFPAYFEGQQLPRREETASAWMVALGTNPYSLDLNTREPGVSAELNLAVGRETRGPSWAPTLRFQIAGGVALPRGIAFGRPECPRCELGINNQWLSFGVMATSKAASVLGANLYLLGGPILSGQWSSSVVRGGDLTVQNSANIPAPGASSQFGVGALGGAGMRFRALGSTFFVEQHAFLPGVVSSPRTRRDDVQFPLILGFRF